MSLQAKLAAFGGDIWKSWGAIAFWPWPAVVFRYPKYKFTWGDYRVFTRWLKPGDIIVTQSEPYFLSNRGIAGTAFKHAAVFTGAVSGIYNKETGFIEKPHSMSVTHQHTGAACKGVFERTVTHAISEGIVCQDVGELLFHTDHAAVLRPPAAYGDTERQTAVNAALGQVGKDYDFAFDAVSSDSFYCTELAAMCLIKASMLVPEKVKRNVSWKGLLLPLDRFKADVYIADSFVKELECVCVTTTCRPEFAKKSQFRDALLAKFSKAVDAEDYSQ
jgi:hypothetical protein